MRVGSGCVGGASGFIAISWCSSEPTTRAFISWAGSDGAPFMYGHADSRTVCARAAESSTLSQYIAERFRDPDSAGQAGVDPSTAKAVGLFGGVAVFTLEGKTQRCILRDDVTGFSTACAAKEQVARDRGRQLYVESLDDGAGYRVYGTAGDASSATLTTASGAKRAVPVSGAGAFVTTTSEKPSSIAFSGGTSPAQMETVTAP